jgi:isopentenyl-diphosphate delta-isomerase
LRGLVFILIFENCLTHTIRMNRMEDKVILVNEEDEETGSMDKMEAHREGALHRAFSIFLLTDNNFLIMQQRADNKYHSGGLWSNTCCSHPLPGEETIAAAHRRLQEELGFDCPLEPLFTFRYQSEVGNGMIENEFDHIFVGRYSGGFKLNEDEVKNLTFMSFKEVDQQLKKDPETYTKWLHLVWPQFKLKIKDYLNS